jgi:hypothetical protein
MLSTWLQLERQRQLLLDKRKTQLAALVAKREAQAHVEDARCAHMTWLPFRSQT